MPSLPKAAVPVQRPTPVGCFEWENDHTEFGQKSRQPLAWIAAQARQQRHGCFGEGRGADCCVARRGKPADQSVVPWLTEEDGHNCGRVDDYTPSGPYPSSSSSSALLSFFPRACAGTVGHISRSKNRTRSA